MKAKAAVPDLVQALNDPEVIVRGMAAASLGSIGDPSAIDPLIAAFADTYQQDPHRWNERDFKWASDIWRALSQLTGQDFGPDYKAWKEWRGEHPPNQQRGNG